MPNWCENKLEIYGKVKQLDKFIKSVKGDNTDLSLEKLYPIKSTDCSNRNDDWGTKWDIDAQVHGEAEDEWISYHFNSAWAPPTGAILKGSGKHSTLQFTLHYVEPGMCFKGVFLCKNGKVVKDEFIDWNWPEE